ncbi:VOC family protein [Virgibacillus sp. MSP4-1]|uniref:VOC family protein n=1 Tax=Virgibacillus sp. MSP4-1 TaxID=2700081 RepID=UPI0003A900DD|nr:VOC family protein [Virgibacillus sp. MSP4-1]QHS22050.1 VOC family protein [Virgibacillus sp. MSP4-1]
MGSRIYPYMILNGEGQEAVSFYQEALGAEVSGLQTFGDMPDNPEYPIPEDAKDRVLNAHLKVGTAEMMISDTFPGQKHSHGSQISIAFVTNDSTKTKETFEKLKEGGEVIMPLQETFWSPLYGQVKDKFGITWQISSK